MKRFIPYLLFLLFVSITLFNLKGQESTGNLSSIPELRLPAEEKIEKYRNDKHFRYEEKKQRQYPEWFLKFLYWLENGIGKALSFVFTKPFIIILFSLLVVALIITIVLRMQDTSLRNFLGRRKVREEDMEFTVEDVNKMDFNRLVEDALRANNYRLAIRFLYLRNLKSLADQGIINWSPNKTNYIYQYEIQDPVLKKKFLDSTRIFDFVWYGEFILDKSAFDEAYRYFEEFNRMIYNER